MIEWGEKGTPTVKAALQGYDRVPYRRLTQPQIKILSTCPDADPATDLVMRCLNDLEFDKPIGMIVGGIPYTAVRMWSKDEGLDDDVRKLLWRALRIVDNERLAQEAADRKAKDPKPGAQQ